MPRSLSAAALGLAITAEVSAAVLLMIPPDREVGAALATAIWTLYLALIVRAIQQNRRDVDCGCSFGGGSRRLGAYQLLRNSLLGVSALLIAVSAASGSLAWQGSWVLASEVLGGVALLALYGALDQVMILPPLREGEIL